MPKAKWGIKAVPNVVPTGDPEDPGSIRIADDPDLASPVFSKTKLAAAFSTAHGPCGAFSSAGDGAGLATPAGPEPGAFWKVLLNVLVMPAWALVLLLSWALNYWQLLFRPLGGYVWWTVDQLDQRAPALVEVLLWAHQLLSLTLHVVTIGVDLGVIWIMWDNGARAAPLIIVAAYALCHYCSGVTMFKELDLRESGGTYFSDVCTLAKRQVDVLCYDVQLVASVVHSNSMLEGMTQLMFKGYEEARLALTTLLFVVPCCVIIGVQYGVFMGGKLKQEIRDLDVLRSYEDQLYAAVCFSVIDAMEKILRFSLVDPWLHEAHDGFPLLYVRSHAARLPGDLTRDWLFRCRVMLAPGSGNAAGGTLVLKELYGFYTRQVKEKVYGLSDPHRAYLLRKALHVYNTRRLHVKPGGAEEAALCGKPLIRSLDATGIAPGFQLCRMLADIVADATHLSALRLGSNAMDDAAVVGVMEALCANDQLAVEHLDLSNNAINAQGAAAVAEMLGANQSIHTLSLAGCGLRDEGAIALSEALKTNIFLYKLDLRDTNIGPEGALALAVALRANGTLTHLNLSGTRIGTSGCDAIAKALRSNPSLKDLDVSHTAIDDKAAASLATMLASNTGLERLALTHTHVTDAGAQLLCNALQGNNTLQAIDVTNNPGMDKSWQKLLGHVVKGKPKA